MAQGLAGETCSETLQRPLPLIINDLVASGRWPFISGELLSSPDLCRILAGMGLQPPRTQALKGILEALGYRPLGRVTVEGLSRRYWSRRPELFARPSGLPDTTAIRRWHLTGPLVQVADSASA